SSSPGQLLDILNSK
nr:Chain C, mRNA decapping protein 2 [Saccharomyces cerevisiae]5LM5_D Chain D, mRNA decapping protein 2 [Saccharomyces cerevisiae]